MSDDDVRRAAEALCDAIGAHGMRNDAVGWNILNKRDNLRTALSRASASGGNPTAWGIENARGAMEPCHFYLSEADARYYISYLNEWGSIDKDRPYRIIPLYRGLTTCGKPLVPNA